MRTDTFKDGYKANMDGLPFDANPHAAELMPVSEKYWEWNKGWSMAHVDKAFGVLNKPKLPIQEHPIFEEGYKAHNTKIPKTMNPYWVSYPANSAEMNNSMQWLNGWYKAELDSICNKGIV